MVIKIKDIFMEDKNEELLRIKPPILVRHSALEVSAMQKSAAGLECRNDLRLNLSYSSRFPILMKILKETEKEDSLATAQNHHSRL